MDLLKVDIEGMEHEALGRCDALQRVGRVIGEIHADLIGVPVEQALEDMRRSAASTTSACTATSSCSSGASAAIAGSALSRRRTAVKPSMMKKKNVTWMNANESYVNMPTP